MELIEKWHQVMQQRDFEQLDAILADEVVMYSPVVFTPQKGKAITKLYLTAAAHVIGNDQFKYTREIVGEREACLEFETEVDGLFINGVDLINWNEEGQITSFKVMIRPLKAVNAVWQGMGKLLEQMKA